MLSLALPSRIFVCTLPTDMRKGFDTLAALVQTYLEQNPLSGDLFVFRSRRGDRLKLLWWDEDGYGLFYKRLEEGSFELPVADGQRAAAGEHGVVLRPAELAMLLEGVDLSHVRRHKRYRRAAAASAR
jgi:transposase